MATCAIACDHTQSTSTVTIAPTTSSTTTTTATATATATATTAAGTHAVGESCTADGDCANGLNCCETGLRGICGGAHMPNVQYEPCVILRTCVAEPCRPMAMPPYGGAFPEDGSLTV